MPKDRYRQDLRYEDVDEKRNVQEGSGEVSVKTGRMVARTTGY